MPPQTHITPGIHIRPAAHDMSYSSLLSERVHYRTLHEGLCGRVQQGLEWNPDLHGTRR